MDDNVVVEATQKFGAKPADAFDGNAFEGKEVRLEVRIAGQTVPLVAVCRPNYITSADLSNYNAAMDEALYNANRKKHIITKLAALEQDDPNYLSLQEELEDIRMRPDDMSLNTESILRPGQVLLSWNYWLDGDYIPIDVESIKVKASLAIVNALATEIIGYVNGNRRTSQDEKKGGKPLFSGSRRNRNR